jgi:hypothetical protein
LSSAPPAPAAATSNAPSVPPPKHSSTLRQVPHTNFRLHASACCKPTRHATTRSQVTRIHPSIHPSIPLPALPDSSPRLCLFGQRWAFYTGMPLSVVSSLLFLPRLLCLTGSLGRRFAFAFFGPLVRLRSVCVCMIPSSSLVALLYITEGRKKIIIKSPNKKDDVQEQEASSRLILPTCEHEK